MRLRFPIEARGNMTRHENPALTLAAHHQHLDATFDDLLRAAETGDPQDLQSTWADFARELRSHLAYEERALLPGFERDAPHEAAVVRREHAEMEATNLAGRSTSLSTTRVCFRPCRCCR
jgi:iron-sulfur cluster repair protein YtfE (RIC family)